MVFELKDMEARIQYAKQMGCQKGLAPAKALMMRYEVYRDDTGLFYCVPFDPGEHC